MTDTCAGVTDPTPHRLSAAELIDLVLDEGSWTSWDVPPVRGEVVAEYAAELAAAQETQRRRRVGADRRGPDARAPGRGA